MRRMYFDRSMKLRDLNRLKTRFNLFLYFDAYLMCKQVVQGIHHT